MIDPWSDRDEIVRFFVFVFFKRLLFHLLCLCDVMRWGDAAGGRTDLLHRPHPPTSMWPCDHSAQTHRTCDRGISSSSEEQEKAVAERFERYDQEPRESSALPSASSAPPPTMDCGIVTSKTVLLFLSLVFWVSHDAVCAPAGLWILKLRVGVPTLDSPLSENSVHVRGSCASRLKSVFIQRTGTVQSLRLPAKSPLFDCVSPHFLSAQNLCASFSKERQDRRVIAKKKKKEFQFVRTLTGLPVSLTFDSSRAWSKFRYYFHVFYRSFGMSLGSVCAL